MRMPPWRVRKEKKKEEKRRDAKPLQPGLFPLLCVTPHPAQAPRGFPLGGGGTREARGRQSAGVSPPTLPAPAWGLPTLPGLGSSKESRGEPENTLCQELTSSLSSPNSPRHQNTKRARSFCPAAKARTRPTPATSELILLTRLWSRLGPHLCKVPLSPPHREQLRERAVKSNPGAWRRRLSPAEVAANSAFGPLGAPPQRASLVSRAEADRSGFRSPSPTKLQTSSNRAHVPRCHPKVTPRAAVRESRSVQASCTLG